MKALAGAAKAAVGVMVESKDWAMPVMAGQWVMVAVEAHSICCRRRINANHVTSLDPRDSTRMLHADPCTDARKERANALAPAQAEANARLEAVDGHPARPTWPSVERVVPARLAGPKTQNES